MKADKEAFSILIKNLSKLDSTQLQQLRQAINKESERRWTFDKFDSEQKLQRMGL